MAGWALKIGTNLSQNPKHPASETLVSESTPLEIFPIIDIYTRLPALMLALLIGEPQLTWGVLIFSGLSMLCLFILRALRYSFLRPEPEKPFTPLALVESRGPDGTINRQFQAYQFPPPPGTNQYLVTC